MKHKAALYGGIFGLIAPIVGLFVGLQVSTFFGTLLTFPVIGLSVLLDTPLGNMSGFEKILGLVASIIFWALVFQLVYCVYKKLRR